MSSINGIEHVLTTLRFTWLSFCLGLLLMLGLSAAPAHAQLNRTWVSSTGSDSNTCSQASPCATFSGAHGKTNAGGEINCLNSGSYGGGLIINKSISIICEGVVGGMLATAGQIAVAVSASATDVVHLRGLDIDGVGTGVIGIMFNAGAALHIENCRIRNFTNAGILSQPTSAASELYVTNTTISHTGAAGGDSGILIQSQPGVVSKAVINQSNVQNNSFGIKADGTGGAGGVINMTVRDTVSAGNSANGIVGTTTASGAAIVMMVDRSASSHNAAGYGIVADGPKTFITFGASSIAGNAFGVGASNGGTLLSYGTNQIYGNSVDGTPATIALK